jgi:hypothetical protein
MAYAVSSLTICAAIDEMGHGQLISIDPYVNLEMGRLTALNQASRAGLQHRHQNHHHFSHTALPELLGQRVAPEFINIDGDHCFDTAFAGFFLSGKLMPRAGALLSMTLGGNLFFV